MYMTPWPVMWNWYATELPEFVYLVVRLNYDGAVSSGGSCDVERVALSGTSLVDSQVYGYVICGWRGWKECKGWRGLWSYGISWLRGLSKAGVSCWCCRPRLYAVILV